MMNVKEIVKRVIYRHGIKNWRLLHEKVRYDLIKDEFKLIREEKIIKYGSASAYKRIWLKGISMRAIEYQDWIAQNQGFKNQKEYLDEKYRAKGFNDKPDRDRFYRLRKKYHKSISDFIVREIQLKKENREVKKELKHFIIIRKSMRHINSGAVKSTGNMYPNKMKTRNEVNGVKPSIHPTIGVCSTQTGCDDMNESLQTESSRSTRLTGILNTT